MGQLPMNYNDDLFEGSLNCSNDAGAIPDALASWYCVVAVVDVEDSVRFMNIPNLVVMSDLLPPPASITAYIDGNPNMGKSIYLSYLADKGREQSVVNILQVLYGRREFIKRNDILLYTDYEPDIEFHILDTLAEFFCNTFGIVINPYKSKSVSHIRNINTDFIIANVLFSNGRINKYEYAMIMPAECTPSYESMSILLSDINYQPGSLHDAAVTSMKYLEQLREEVKSNYRCKSPIIIANEKINADLELDINEDIFNKNQ